MTALSISKRSFLMSLGLLCVCIGLAVGTSRTAFAHVSTFYWNRSWYLSQQNKGTDEEVEQKKKELIEKIETSRLYRFIKNNILILLIVMFFSISFYILKSTLIY